jgi:hypothetical protein
MVSASATYADESPRRRRMPLAWLAGLLAAGSVVGLATFDTSRAAFSGSTGNSGSSFAAGTVTLSDDDNNSIFFQMSGMVPGSTQTKCVNVTYTGVPANIRLYGSVSASAATANLAPYLTTEIEEGSGAAGGAGLSCTGFTPTSPTATFLHGTAAGSVTLQDFSDNVDFATGLPAFGGIPTSGGTQSRSYRIKVVLQDDNAAQGKDANATFTWEAQNV